MLTSRHVALVAAFAGVLGACQPEPTEYGPGENYSEARTNVDALDYATAKSRANRVSNVEY